MKQNASEFLPLSAATTHILLALMGEDRHGYGILLEVARQSGGEYKIGPGTLYDNLKKLLKSGLVEEVAPAVPSGEARREYHLTELGAAVLTAEIERMAQVVREARRGLRLREEGQ